MTTLMMTSWVLATGSATRLVENPIDTVVNLTAFGVLCLLVLHVFRHTIPRLAGNFERAIDKITVAYTAELHDSRKVFTEELRIQRQDFKEFLMQQHQQIDKLTDSVQELTQRIEERAS